MSRDMPCLTMVSCAKRCSPIPLKNKKTEDEYMCMLAILYIIILAACFNPSHLCNCDTIDDNTPRGDGGVLTDKLYLPVTELHFLENSISGNLGRLQLGDFVCDGIGKYCVEIKYKNGLECNHDTSVCSQ